MQAEALPSKNDFDIVASSGYPFSMEWHVDIPNEVQGELECIRTLVARSVKSQEL